jgi:hypothetical protein
MEELRRQFPSITAADAKYVKFAVLGIAWGLEEQARRIIRVVSAVVDDPRSGPAAVCSLAGGPGGAGGADIIDCFLFVCNCCMFTAPYVFMCF